MITLRLLPNQLHLIFEDSDVYGCTDEEAENYNPEANIDDGNCQYPIAACDLLPQGLFVDNIIHNKVRFNWSEPEAYPSYYMIRYRPVGTSSWIVMTAGQRIQMNLLEHLVLVILWSLKLHISMEHKS